MGRLGTPVVEVARGTQGPVSGNYRGDVLVIRIKDSITENSGATKIRYTIDGGKTYKELNRQGTDTEFNIYDEGNYTIYAYMKNSGGESGKSNELKVILDRTKPTVTLEPGTSTTTSLNVTAKGNDTLSGIYSYNYKWNFTGPNTEWTGAYDPQITSATSHEAGFTIGPGSKIWLGATVTDKAGNESYFSNGFWMWTKANAPTITVLNENVWAKTKTVQITGIENHKIKYTTNGSTPTATNGAELTGTGAKTFTVGVNNTVVKAVYVNTVTGAVNSDIGTKTVTKIDTTPPTIAELELISSTASEIKVRAKGADTESGVDMYTFQMSTASATSGFGDSRSYQVTAGTQEHTYAVNANTTYYLRVLVKDKAGNVKTSNVLTVKSYHNTPYFTGTLVGDTWTKDPQVTWVRHDDLSSGERLAVKIQVTGKNGTNYEMYYWLNRASNIWKQ